MAYGKKMAGKKTAGKKMEKMDKKAGKIPGKGGKKGK